MVASGSATFSSNGEQANESSAFYAVAIGRTPGIYTDAKLALEQTEGFPGARCKKFKDRKPAEEFIVTAEAEAQAVESKVFYAVAVGRTPGIYTDARLALEQTEGFPGFKCKKFKDRKQAEEFLATAEAEVFSPGPFYAVKVGRVPGVYTNSEDCVAQVDCYAGAVYRKFASLDEAQDFVNQRTAEGLGAASIQDVQGTFYAVREGFRRGVFTDFEEYRRQVVGYRGFVAKRFNNLADAEAYCAARDIPGKPAHRFYAIRAGRQPGIYTQYEDVLRQLYAFPGRDFKAFDFLEEAEAFLAAPPATQVRLFWDADNTSYADDTCRAIMEALRRRSLPEGAPEPQILSLDVFASNCTASHLAGASSSGGFPPGGVLHVDIARSWDNPADARLAQSVLETILALPPGDDSILVIVTSDHDFRPLISAVHDVAPTVRLLRAYADFSGDGQFVIAER